MSIETEIEKHLDKIKKIDDNLFGAVCGVTEAIVRTRDALYDIDHTMAKRKFHRLGAIGYGDITSNFVFLQRTLGTLQTAYDDKTKLVSSIASSTNKSYEEIEPFVDAKLSSMKPRQENKIDIAEAKKRVQAILNYEHTKQN